MNDRESTQLNQLIDAVHASHKYKHISKDFITNLGSRELAKRQSLKDAIKSTKNKLHQVGAAYLESEIGRDKSSPYTSWLAELKQAAQQDDKEQLRHVCKKIMSYHASTRERLPILEQFYATILADLPPINSVIDLACGLHPLAIPWMPLREHA